MLVKQLMTLKTESYLHSKQPYSLLLAACLLTNHSNCVSNIVFLLLGRISSYCLVCSLQQFDPEH